MTAHDQVKFERYNRILANLSTVKTMEDFENFSIFSMETLRMDLRVMTIAKLVQKSYHQAGRFNHRHASFIAVKPELTLDDYKECKRITAELYSKKRVKRTYAKQVRQKSSVVGNVTTFNIDDYKEKVNATARISRRASPKNYAGTSAGLVW